MNFSKATNLLITAVLLLAFGQAKAANIILNGGFETNTASNTLFNLSNSDFTATVANATGFGPANELDLITPTNGFYTVPQSGNWSVVLHEQNVGTPDAFSFNLSAPVLAGTSYTLDFYALSDLGAPSQILIGLSNSANSFGTQVFSTNPSASGWQHFTHVFTPAASADFLTVSAGAILDGVTNVDNFSLTASGSSSVPEPSSVFLFAFGAVFCFRRHTPKHEQSI